MELFINLLGFGLLWLATDVGRTEDSKIKIFSKGWWLILVLVVIGSMLSQYSVTLN